MLRPHDRIFIRLDKTPECDGQTDRQPAHSYYSGVHCAVKTDHHAARSLHDRITCHVACECVEVLVQCFWKVAVYHYYYYMRIN